MKNNNRESGEIYLERVEDAFWEAACEGDWVNFRSQSRLSGEIYDVVERTRKLIAKGKYEPAIEIAFAIMRNGVELVNHNDDSYGYLGSIMRYGTELLNKLVSEQLDEDCRELFEDECWECIDKKLFYGWDWHADMYGYLAHLAESPADCKKIVERLEKDPKFQSDFYKDRLHTITLQLKEKSDGSKAAHEYMMQNLQVKEFRERAVKEAIQQKDYPLAYRLCEEGIAIERYSDTWHQLLLEAAQSEGNRERIIEQARYLYLDAFVDYQDYYTILKKNVPKDSWPAFAESLAEDARESHCTEQYVNLCVCEGWHDRLLEFIDACHDIRILQKNESILLPSHKDEVEELYVKHIYHLMECSRNRSTYVDICHYLKHIRELGAADLVTTTVATLRTKYKRCRLLMEMLNNMNC